MKKQVISMSKMSKTSKAQLIKEAKDEGLDTSTIKKLENLSETQIKSILSDQKELKQLEKDFPLDLDKFDLLSTRERSEIRKMTLKNTPIQADRVGNFSVSNTSDMVINQDLIMYKMLEIGRGLNVDEEIKKGRKIKFKHIQELYKDIEAVDPLGLTALRAF